MMSGVKEVVESYMFNEELFAKMLGAKLEV